MRTFIRTITSSTISCISQGCGRVFAIDSRDDLAMRLRAFFAVVVHVVGKHVPPAVTTAAAAAGAYPAAGPQRNRLGWQQPTLVNAG